MKRTIFIIWILFFSSWFYTNATNFLEIDEVFFWWYFSGSQNNQTQLHFNHGWQDFAGTIFWKDAIDITATITISWWETKICNKKLRWLYYNNKRGNRLRPLDQQSLNELQNLDSSYNELEITWWFYTMCDGTGSEVYGYIKHTRNNVDYKMLAGIEYNFWTNTYFNSFSENMYFQSGNVHGFIYDKFGGISNVSWIWLTISDISTESPDTEHSNWGWGWIKLYKDDCPDWDYSPSYYDGVCWKIPIKNNEKIPTHGSANLVGDITDSLYSNELNNAYQRTYSHGITTMSTIQKANIEWTLIRKDMAKMITEFATNILGKNISTGTICEFDDIEWISKEMQAYAIASCKLWLMGLENDGLTPKKNFDPNQEVTRAQFGTILSRLLRVNKYDNGKPYYKNHLQALKTEWIMTKIENPSANEMRWRVMLMLMRVFNK